MDLFDFRDRPPVPWKNGGGTTRALAQDDGGDGGPAWRLSLADIDKNGPFSVFPGMQRYHVIVRGAGLQLSAPNDAIQARPFCPVAFSGNIPYTARLADGPCQAVNLIFDPSRVAARVAIAGDRDWIGGETQSLIVCLGGSATLKQPEDAPVGSVLVAGQCASVPGSVRVQAAQDARLVCFALTDLKQAPRPRADRRQPPNPGACADHPVRNGGPQTKDL